MLDLTSDQLPLADAVFCRDCMVHLSHRLVMKALGNIRWSGARYLIATTFPTRSNVDIVTGNWRPINLCAPPFSLPAPMRLISEQHPEPYADKHLGVWRVADL